MKTDFRCCAGLCEYRPDAVAAHMGLIRRLRAIGEDPAEAARSVFGGGRSGRGGFGGGDTGTRYAVILIDVEAAMRAAGPDPSPEDVARRLCPFAVEEGEEAAAS